VPEPQAICIVLNSDGTPEKPWLYVSEDIQQKARDLCAADGNDPDWWTEDGYGPGWGEDGNHTTQYAEAEPFWSLYLDDAIEALKPST
jgi:wyosine [tRNA(Phe)-imidazoG37] synthetase (radical SAM superfamily)